MPDSAEENTDQEIYREPTGEHYAPAITVTKDGGIGITVGGHTIVATLREWHRWGLFGRRVYGAKLPADLVQEVAVVPEKAVDVSAR